MHLLKTISLCDMGRSVRVVDGVRAVKMKDHYRISDPFWGDADITIDKYADVATFSKTDNENEILIPYVTSFAYSPKTDYYVKDIGDGFKKIWFHVNGYIPDKIEGYIIFIKKSIGEIKTSGNIIYQRYHTEMVVLLEEGNYLNFEGKKIEVINNKLVLVI